jgi:signal transduction histidine kinase
MTALAVLLASGGWAAAAIVVLQCRRRAELVARARHEIAGPLQAAGLALHAARRERPSPRLAAVDLELRRAALALCDLDAARRGGRAEDTVQSVDVGCLLAEQALAWQIAARAQGRTLRVAAASGLLVRADPVRLAQAVGNLLANAVEHGDGTIVLRAAAEGATVRIEVGDDGPGLSGTLRRPRTGRGARGRGLVIAAEIAARQGGRLAFAGGAHPAIELPAA